MSMRLLRVLAAVLALAGPLACQEKAAPTPPPAGSLRMTVFELPLHGLAIALETPSGALYLVDTGKKEGDADAGKDVIAPFLKARGVKEIAGILVSHPHRDHFEGAAYLLKHFRVKSFIDGGIEGPLVDEDYAKLKTHAREKGAELRTVRAGDVLKWDDALEVTVLGPPKTGVAAPDKDFLNDNSVVLRIRHGANVLLLPGDIESEGRDSLLAHPPADGLKATVLVAPHHGFSSGKRFAEAVKAETVVVSCLADYPDKKPRSPGQAATEFFGAAGAKVYVTAWHGPVEITSDGKTCAVRTAREKK